MSKWCSYCRKADHDDAECWCTRQVSVVRDPMAGLSFRQLVPPVASGKLQQALEEAVSATACGCVGPQNGQPLCPCQMRGVQIKDGRYVRIQDLGPAP